MVVFIKDIHRPAHHHQGVVAIQRRDRFALVEFNGIPGDPRLVHEIAEDAGVLNVDMC